MINCTQLPTGDTNSTTMVTATTECDGSVNGTQFDEDDDVVLAIPRAIFYAVVMIIMVGGNILVMVVIARTPALQTVTNKFVMWLAAADTLVGVSILLRLIQVLAPSLLQDFVFCMVRYWSITFTGLWSAIILLSITVERYVGVFRSMYYNMIITERRVDVGIALTGMICFSVACIPPLGYNTWYPGVYCDYYTAHPLGWICIMYTVFVTVTLTTAIVYGLIVWETRKMYARLRTLNPTERDSKEKELRDENKAIKTFCLVVGIFTFTWGPMLTTSVAFSTDPDYYYNHNVYNTVWTVMTLGVLINSLCNPFIYALRMASFRKPMLRILCCGRHGNSPQNDVQSPVQPRPLKAICCPNRIVPSNEP